ncbi:MAG TPA: RNB domain-containing ribonuclease [Longimicrobiaceae bacterium]|nr:RNB domain-containing ribonuclease [Longimicrobiaceae bacterium]
MPEHESALERAFASIRAELEIRDAFPPEVERAAEAAAGSRAWEREDREDLTAIPFVTIDPPGSRDLDQALHLERAGDGYRVRYAIADVACFVERGGPIEQEAWLRGETYYAPDQRNLLYPQALSEGGASLLADDLRPASCFTIELDGAGGIVRHDVVRAKVKSRAKLTYQQALRHAEGGGDLFRGEPFSESLLLLKTVGELRQRCEVERGGVSLPIPEQHVQRRAARALGYELEYEEPNAAEGWNAQISLLTGHVAAERMMKARVGMIRTMPPPSERDVLRFRTAARALGFSWPEEESYAAFIHSLRADQPRAPTLAWQAKHLMKGADYVAFDGAPPEHPEHSALAMVYAHATAPLRRLGDRYVLDLLVELARGERPSEEERKTLLAVPPVMNAADTRAGKLERRVVNTAEAWVLRDRVGETIPGFVLDVQPGEVEVQLEDPPVRDRALRREGAAPALGQPVEVCVAGVRLDEGRVELQLARSAEGEE